MVSDNGSGQRLAQLEDELERLASSTVHIREAALVAEQSSAVVQEVAALAQSLRQDIDVARSELLRATSGLSEAPLLERFTAVADELGQLQATVGSINACTNGLKGDLARLEQHLGQQSSSLADLALRAAEGQAKLESTANWLGASATNVMAAVLALQSDMRALVGAHASDRASDRRFRTVMTVAMVLILAALALSLIR